MEKMRMESLNLTSQNIEKIEALFPNCVTESKDENGKLKKSINFKMLKQMLSDDIVDGEEVYEFTWVGKKAAIIEANKPIRKTLRPVLTDSVNWDNTENIYIEGKNIDTLKLIQESYLGKVQMIYIDPPYNTGTNIIYPNDYSMSLEEYDEISGVFDDFGNMMIKNSNSNGRFHSDWCSIIYSVLLTSKNLLKNTGFIVLAMDDNELYTLKMMCDEVFGESNYIGTIVTRSNPQGRNKNNLDPVHEYHLVYAKNIQEMPLLKIKKDKNSKNAYGNLMRSGTNSRKHERPYRFYPILEKNGELSMISLEEYKKIYSEKKEFNENYLSVLREKYELLGYNFILPIAKNGEEKVWQRTFDRVLNEYKSYIFDKGQIKTPSDDIRTPISLWIEDIHSNVSYGTNKLKELFDNNSPFDYSKSIFTVKDLVSLNTKDNDIVLDFFSGSATTAHAVMQLNAEDGGNRKFIMVQVPEETDEKSDAYKAGYKNICEIGKERIRRAGDKIKSENPLLTSNLDTGFRVLKVDSSNMKDVYYSPNEISQDFLSALESNIKEDRTDLDLLFGCLLEWGLPLSLPYKSIEIDGCVVHNYNEGDLIACFEENISENVMKEIAKLTPLRAVFRDSSFENSAEKINTSEIFKLLSPDTKIKVI